MPIENLTIKISEDSVLTIVIDLKKTLGDSQSGRSKVICTSGGNLRLPDNVGGFRDEILNLSVCKRKPGTRTRRWSL